MVGADEPPGPRAVDEATPQTTVPDRARAPDTTPPSVSITSASATGDGATFAFTASERGVTLACALDGGGFEPCAPPKTYSGLAPGAHTFQVRATDAAGNTGAPDGHSWRISEALPDLVVTALTETGFTVVNTGAAAAGPFVVSVTLVGSYTFAGLPAGAAVTRTWRCQSGTLSVIADRGDTVAESDEANNRRSLVSRC